MEKLLKKSIEQLLKGPKEDFLQKFSKKLLEKSVFFKQFREEFLQAFGEIYVAISKENNEGYSGRIWKTKSGEIFSARFSNGIFKTFIESWVFDFLERIPRGFLNKSFGAFSVEINGENYEDISMDGYLGESLKNFAEDFKVSLLY